MRIMSRERAECQDDILYSAEGSRTLTVGTPDITNYVVYLILLVIILLN